MTFELRGLYAITEESATDGDQLAKQVAAAIAGGARAVQYRDKTQDQARRRDQASALLKVCQRHQVPLLINDDVDLALAIGADGVHLGEDDEGLAAARARLPRTALVGCSCYDRFDLAVRAVAGGADYVAFGSFFASPTKPHAVPASPELLVRARHELRIPAVAIGGITPENGAALVRAGASMLAVITALFGSPDIKLAAQAFAPCFRTTEENP